MVNDLFLQWLSLPDTRSTLYAALHSVQTNGKMPDPIVYPKVRMLYSIRPTGKDRRVMIVGFSQSSLDDETFPSIIEAKVTDRLKSFVAL